MDTKQQLHDKLLAEKPEGANHEAAGCEFCEKRSGEGPAMADEKILTQEQHDSLLTSAVQKAKQEAASAVDKEILSLNERAEAAETALKAMTEENETLKKAASDREETDRVTALAAERAKLVKEAVPFTDEQVETRKAQWAAMSEDGFKVYLEDLKETAKVSGKTPPKPKEAVPASKFEGTRETAGEEGTEQSAVEAFFKSDALALAELS